MNIAFRKAGLVSQGTLVISAYKNGILGPLGDALDKKLDGVLKNAFRSDGFGGEVDELVHILVPAGSDLDRIVVVGLGDPKDVGSVTIEKAAAQAYECLGDGKCNQATLIFEQISGVPLNNNEIASHAALGMTLRSYKFDQYQLKKNRKDRESKKKRLSSIEVGCSNRAATEKLWFELGATAKGVFLARDLINEPPNVLHTEEFVRRCRNLSKIGIKVKVLNESQMARLGMVALLSVGQGSCYESFLVIMSWMGDVDGNGKTNSKPLAFVGKGVCFDSGGISIKVAKDLDWMKADMGGAAVVTGLMKTLASRKAKVNVVGVIGLVENMLSSKAYRPGDIISSMSGQTIEVLNTDAEGRLVLADALWYTQEKIKPRWMVDLATLTGAVITALGNEHAGVFTNSDELADHLQQAGADVDEPVWRLPLSEHYDKQTDSKVADVSNLGRDGAGATTAAQFLQRFTNDIPWAHVDIAGMTFERRSSPLVKGWGTGYGVRLLDRLIANSYEKRKTRRNPPKKTPRTEKKAHKVVLSRARRT